jgi:glycogen operon protein
MIAQKALSKGSPASLTLGASWDGTGTRFTVFSAHAEAIELCLFENPDSPAAARRVSLERKKSGLWSAYLPETGPGTLYGYRADGPFAPADGHRFNPSKLLIDPYAMAVTGEPAPSPAIFGYRRGSDLDRSFDRSDSAGAMPKAVVVDGAFDWQGVAQPLIPWPETVIYEAHLKGLTRLHPEVPPEHRGKYLGLTAPAVIEHLKRLGVTTVELLPLCQFASEEHLLKAGRRKSR